MPPKKPGPLGTKPHKPIDKGTLKRQRSRPPGPTGVKPAPKVAESKPAAATPVAFKDLWSAYPNDKPYVDATGNPPPGYDNQCAIKVSVALQGAGVSMSSFKKATVSIKGKSVAIRAEELAAWLKAQKIKGLSPTPENITGSDWQTKIKDRTGIVFFANYWKRDKETTPSGDHIDLWNGASLTASGLAGAIVTFLRFNVGMSSGPGFSDLGNATSILFWEVK